MDAAALRARLVDELKRSGTLADPAVEKAFRAIPRHLFVPEVAPDEAYRDRVILTKQAPDGAPLSSASQPSIVALMLQQLELAPGQNVLEIGAGTGYNAALVGCVVGDAGAVTTVDIDADTVERACDALAAAGVRNVRTVQGDGALGCAASAPYDRIIATAGAWDIPPAWCDQLAPDGIIVLPLSIRGVDASVAFGRRAGGLTSRSVIGCGFMPMRGVLSQHRERSANVAEFQRVLEGPRFDLSTGISATRMQVWTSLDLWLALYDTAFVRVEQEPEPERAELPAPLTFAVGSGRSAALVEEGGLAVVTYRAEPGATADDPESRIALGVSGFGRDRERLAARLADHIATWWRNGPPAPDRMTIDVLPRDALVPRRRGVIVDKHFTRLVVEWAKATD